MSSHHPHVLAVVVAFHRPGMLQRLLHSLGSAEAEGLRGVIVVDNSRSPAIAAIAQSSALVRRYLPQTENRGTGAGHAIGLNAAQQEPAATHFWLMDDDIVVGPGTLRELLIGIRKANAGLVVPLLENAAGTLGWFPGLAEPRAWKTIREPLLNAHEFVQRCGEQPVPFTWAPWCMMLLTRAAVETVGVPREDFGFMSDDLEFSARVANRLGAHLIPTACVKHLPPRLRDGPEAFYIDCLHLQNLFYLALRLPHGRRMRRHLPGAWLRFLRRHGMRGIIEAARAIWRGAVAGQPGGSKGGDGYWRQLKALGAPSS